MSPDQEKQMQALFAAGDPAARVSELLPQRVAARLAERPAPAWHAGWARAVAVGLVLASSAGLGAAAVWATNAASKGAVEAPAPAKAAVAAQPADPLGVEAGLLRSALEALQGGDTQGALAKLDERDRRFPGGALQSEAAVTRARVLMREGRCEAALRLLEGIEG